MAKIPVYEAPDRAVRTEREGYAANETAGRRIGPAFDKAASDVRAIGAVTASIYKQRLWPFDILELEQNQTSGGGSGSGRGSLGHGGGGGGGFKVEGGVNNLMDGLHGAGATGRLGNVAAAAAQHFTGTQSRGGKLVSPPGGGAVDDRDPQRSKTINDNRALQPGTFPEHIGESTTWPRGRQEQPANPDFLRREAEQQVWRDPYELSAPAGYEDMGGNYGGGYTPPQQESSFPGSVWQGLSNAASWLGGGSSSIGSASEGGDYGGGRDE